MALKPPYRPLIWIVATGISLSGLASWWVGRWERSLRQLEFERQTASLTVALAGRLGQYTETLLALGDFYAISQGEVSREEFGGFVARVLDTYPGIQALEWAPWVRNGARPQFEQDLTGWMGERVEITEQRQGGGLIRAQGRGEYFPVSYIEPWQGNEVALGFDLLSNQVRSQALNQARQTGQVTATAPIRLVQELQDQAGFLVFLPVYGEGQELRGMLLGVFRVSDVVVEAVRSLQMEINFTLQDGTGNGGQFLGFYDAQAQEVQPIPASPPTNPATQLLCPHGCQQIIAVSQRQWQIQFYPGPGYALEPRWAMGATLTIGLLLTAIVALLGWNWQTQLEQTQAMGELKLKFFSMTSHEFRNPLSTILISSQFLISHGSELAEPKRLSIYQRIHEVARYMGQMLEDILMLSRAEAGHLSCHPEIVELEPLCQTILAEFNENLEKNGPISYQNDYPYAQVFVDPKLIRSILTNLLNNAVKYSDIHSLVALHIAGNSRQLTIEVKDQGIGIDFTEQPYIFDPFYRGSNAEKLIGTGLGLAVVKTCVELHHGAIGLESHLNKGTRFYITLPLEA